MKRPKSAGKAGSSKEKSVAIKPARSAARAKKHARNATKKTAKKARQPAKKQARKLARPSKKESKRVPPIAPRKRAKPIERRASNRPIVINSVDDLHLSSYAREGATQLFADHPEVVFTSGLRGVQQQADAMAGHIVNDRLWIKKTYADSAQSRQLQKWVDDHPEVITRAAISAGLKGIMDNWSMEQRAVLSRHFNGLCFDVNPVEGAAGDAIKTAIQHLPNLKQFLDHEGNAIVWHAEFYPKP